MPPPVKAHATELDAHTGGCCDVLGDAIFDKVFSRS